MKRIHPWLRAIFLAGFILSLLAGIQLYLLSDRTGELFSWTIQSTLTAATYGAFYFGTMTFALLAVREKEWASVRAPALGLLVFMFVTMAATLLHIDKFHLASEDFLPRASAWLWMSIYMLFPFAIVGALIRQGQMTGVEPERISRMPAWFRLVLILHGTSGIAAALFLFLLPQTVIPMWPWALTPLTARALAAWLVSFGALDLLVIREDDLSRSKIMAIGYIVSGTLAVIALLRYSSQVNWQSVGAYAWVGYIVIMVITGVTGIQRSRRT